MWSSLSELTANVSEIVAPVFSDNPLMESDYEEDEDEENEQHLSEPLVRLKEPDDEEEWPDVSENDIDEAIENRIDDNWDTSDTVPTNEQTSASLTEPLSPEEQKEISETLDTLVTPEFDTELSPESLQSITALSPRCYDVEKLTIDATSPRPSDSDPAPDTPCSPTSSYSELKLCQVTVVNFLRRLKYVEESTRTISIGTLTGILGELTQKIESSEKVRKKNSKLEKKIQSLQIEQENLTQRLAHVQETNEDELQDIQSAYAELKQHFRRSKDQEVHLLSINENLQEELDRSLEKAKAYQSEIQALKDEAQEQKVTLQQLERIADSQLHKLNKGASSEEAYLNLQEKYNSTIIELEEVKENYRLLSQEFHENQQQTEEMRLEYEQREQDLLYHVDSERSDDQLMNQYRAQIKTLQADKAIAEQDAERYRLESSNLESVLEQFQTQRNDQIEKLKAKLEAMEATKLEEVQAMDAQFQQERATLLEQQQHYQKELSQQSDRATHLQQKVDKLNQQIQSLQSNCSIDAPMVTQLFVKYYESDFSKEILELLSRILEFSDEDKRRVGLVDLSEELLNPENLEGKSFTEMWSAFLEHEAH